MVNEDIEEVGEAPADVEVEFIIEGEEPEAEEAMAPPGHFDNLVDRLDKTDLSKAADQVMDWVEADEQVWAKSLDQFNKGLEIIGLVPNKEEGPFSGASKVTHPMIIEAAVHFNARALVQFFPPGGPTKAEVIGEPTPELEAQADRVKEYLDYHYLVEDEGFFSETDQMLFILPLAGCMYRKTYFDPIRKTVKRCLIKQEKNDRVLLPYSASSIFSSDRVTHCFDMTDIQFSQWVESGYYADVASPATADLERDSQADEAAGRDPVSADGDEVRRIAECFCMMDLEDGPSPYIISIERESMTVVRVQRNWAEQDDDRKPERNITQYIYFPGLGPQGMGLIQAIGGLNDSAQGAIRALLDSAARANCPGGLKSRDTRLRGMKSGDITIEPGVFKEVDLTYEELQKAFFIPPLPPPNPALAQLFGNLLQSGQRFASISDSMVGQANNSAPVGTTVALIEQATAPFTAIHKRIHNAFADEMRITCRLFGRYGKEEYPYAVKGRESIAFRADFDDRVDVIPLSDPTLVTKTQKIALAQEKLKLAAMSPGLYDMYEVHKTVLAALDERDIDKLLVDPSDIPYTDPISEGAYAMVGRPIITKPDEDHQAHIIIHQGQIQALPQDMQGQAMALKAHIAEHIAQAYMVQASLKMGIPLPPLEVRKPRREDVPAEINMQITAAAAGLVQQTMTQAQDPQMEAAKSEDEHKLKAADIMLREQELLQERERDAMEGSLKSQELALKRKGMEGI